MKKVTKEQKGKQILPEEEEDHTQKMKPQQNPIICDRILPEDMIFEILSRLPVKSLLRFKCVCKPWQTLISSPIFIRSHSTHSPNSLVFQHYPVLGYILYLLKSPTDAALVQIPGPECGISEFGFPKYGIDVLGSTNGAVFFTTPDWNDALVLWNPATKQARCIPPLESEICDLPADPDWKSWGFGYDPIGDKFTVVLIFSNPLDKNIPGPAYGFSTNSGSWRKMKFELELPGSWVEQCMCEAIVEGVPCWRGSAKEGEEIREVVICFDVVNDGFSQFSMPDIEKDRCKQLVEYKHSLGMVVWDDSEMNYFDLWVMEESWSKKFVVGPVFARMDGMLGFRRDSELIGEDDDGLLVMYNVESRRMRRVHIRHPMGGYRLVYHYSETLVSVTGEKIVEGTRERTEAVARGPLLRRLLRESKGRFSSGK